MLILHDSSSPPIPRPFAPAASWSDRPVWR
ncbi:hypothetical protein CGMCC3_g6447 [Colletotrichum fructicola]|nr:uncharacterized protein CGMCC3_g6447 [Colletotrichum fructicola]KAE9577518.1 hypothetical protein CGMCC3_g6447 [Colletotrichum fructicola]